jgi:hypothetical protein
VSDNVVLASRPSSFFFLPSPPPPNNNNNNNSKKYRCDVVVLLLLGGGGLVVDWWWWEPLDALRQNDGCRVLDTHTHTQYYVFSLSFFHPFFLWIFIPSSIV